MGDHEVKLPIDIQRIRYDVNGDGQATDEERLMQVIARLARLDDLPDAAVVAFDHGDALWLRRRALMALDDFLLAHDWHESFEVSFHLFFPRLNLPFAAALGEGGGEQGNLINEAAPFADIASFIHLIRWPAVEPDRMKVVRQNLKDVIAISRQSWDAIEAETDDDREWLPSPRQTSYFARLSVTAERLAACGPCSPPPGCSRRQNAHSALGDFRA